MVALSKLNGRCCDTTLGIYLHSKYDYLTLAMGILCSTFVQINAGTSGRDLLTPEGIWWHPSVAKSNLLVCRQVGRAVEGWCDSLIGFATTAFYFLKRQLC